VRNSEEQVLPLRKGLNLLILFLVPSDHQLQPRGKAKMPSRLEEMNVIQTESGIALDQIPHPLRKAWISEEAPSRRTRIVADTETIGHFHLRFS
jgi:hypothetical protein